MRLFGFGHDRANFDDDAAKVYKVNLFLLRLASEDGAQEAMKAELERQFGAQGSGPCSVDVVLDLNITKTDITYGGVPVVFTDEPL